MDAPDKQACAQPAVWRLERWHWIVLCVALVLRLMFAATVDREASFGGWDGQEYHAYAQSLARFAGDDYPRYFNVVRAPFYPVFLLPFVALSSEAVWPVQAVQCLLGVLQAWLLGLLTARWAGTRAGNWAFLLAAFNLFLIYFCAFVLTECVFITLLWAGLACLQRLGEASPTDRRRWLCWGGVAIGLACLTRPALQPFLIVAVFWIGTVIWQRSGFGAAILSMAGFTAITSALMLPWMLGNVWVHGEFTLAPRNAPLVYAQSHSEEYLAMYRAKSKDEYYRALTAMVERMKLGSGTGPGDWTESARRFRVENRAGWWELQRHKAVHFWTPWVNPLIFPRTHVLASLVALAPLFLLAAFEMWRRIRGPDAFFVLLLGLVAVGWLVGGILFHVQVRYRIPFVDLSFLVLSAAWLGRWDVRAWRKGKTAEVARG
jgi:4-amino-4-deoxy-L-arabinose transferase-like glycosyltransferase